MSCQESRENEIIKKVHIRTIVNGTVTKTTITNVKVTVSNEDLLTMFCKATKLGDPEKSRIQFLDCGTCYSFDSYRITENKICMDGSFSLLDVVKLRIPSELPCHLEHVGPSPWENKRVTLLVRSPSLEKTLTFDKVPISIANDELMNLLCARFGTGHPTLTRALFLWNGKSITTGVGGGSGTKYTLRAYVAEMKKKYRPGKAIHVQFLPQAPGGLLKKLLKTGD